LRRHRPSKLSTAILARMSQSIRFQCHTVSRDRIVHFSCSAGSSLNVFAMLG